MLEVGSIVEVCDIDTGSSRGVGSLHRDQLGEFDPPEVSLCRGTEM